MILKRRILSDLKSQQYSLEDIRMAHSIVLAMSNIFGYDTNPDSDSEMLEEVFDTVEETLEAILEE